MAKSIKREQEVVVIAGSHKGKRGKVLEVMGNDRVLVEGVNMILSTSARHRKTQKVHQSKEKHQFIIQM